MTYYTFNYLFINKVVYFVLLLSESLATKRNLQYNLFIIIFKYLKFLHNFKYILLLRIFWLLYERDKMCNVSINLYYLKINLLRYLNNNLYLVFILFISSCKNEQCFCRNDIFSIKEDTY